MKTLSFTSDQLHCPKCGTIIPKGQTQCPNPKCPTNQPIHGIKKNSVIQTFELI
jgi:hypothetical protein